MNPKNILFLLLIIVLTSCGTSSNFQKRKFLNLKPLETSELENIEPAKKNGAEFLGTDFASNENQKEQPHEIGNNFTEQSLKDPVYSDLLDGQEKSNPIVEERFQPEKTAEKNQELLEPDDPIKSTRQRKAIIFGSIGFGLVILASLISILLFLEFISILGIILSLIFIVGAVIFGILAIVNAAKALRQPKDGVRDWVLRFLSLGAGIIAVVGGSFYFVELIFYILFF